LAAERVAGDAQTTLSNSTFLILVSVTRKAWLLIDDSLKDRTRWLVVDWSVHQSDTGKTDKW